MILEPSFGRGADIIRMPVSEQKEPLSPDERKELAKINLRLGELQEELEITRGALTRETEPKSAEKEPLKTRILKKLSGWPQESSALAKAKIRTKEAGYNPKTVEDAKSAILKEMKNLEAERTKLESRLPTDERLELEKERQQIKEIWRELGGGRELNRDKK